MGSQAREEAEDPDLRLERVVAHRELQFLRACSGRKKPKYVKQRWGKLQEVKRAQERMEKRSE